MKRIVRNRCSYASQMSCKITFDFLIMSYFNLKMQANESFKIHFENITAYSGGILIEG